MRLGCFIITQSSVHIPVGPAPMIKTVSSLVIPDSVTDEQALLVGDVLATGFWAARISEITEDDTILIIGAGPTGICTLLCVMLKQPKRIIVCEKSEERRNFVREHYPNVLLTTPEECKDFVLKNSDHSVIVTNNDKRTIEKDGYQIDVVPISEF